MTRPNNIAMAQGAVLPPADKIKLSGDSFDIEITEVYPENGIGVPSENVMVGVAYPAGQIKRHQVKDIGTLSAAVTGFIQRVYNITGFDFALAPKELEVGQKFTINKIKYED
jgi:hypothetical protein